MPQKSSENFSIALQHLLDLICDSVAGLVEIQYVKRNTIGTANALVAADIALASVNKIINVDEGMEAMYREMPREVRKIGVGGISATTPTRLPLKVKFQKGNN